jgi:serine/threonine protein kinase
MNYNGLFDGKYRILRPLGQGGMSTVYLAENAKLGTLWAIKEINKNSKVDILIEPNILKRLNHPALPRIFDIIEDEENVYIVVDYIEGTPLDVDVEIVGKYPEQKVIGFALEICDVLSYLHTQKPNPIIYRDMKPGNIILSKDGSIKLIDFGIAREYKEESSFDTVYIGTRGYAAPEQYGSGQTNERTDIYSLGVTLYHLATGKSPNDPPYEIKPIRLYDSNLSEELDSIISKCTRQDPEERYGSIAELLTDLKKACNKNSKGNIESINIRKEYERKSPISFKKLVLSVLGNSEFAAEAAYVITNLTDFKVILINLDFITSNLDLNLNLVPNLDKYASSRNENFGFNMIMEAMETNSFNQEILEKACIKTGDLSNLFVLTDPYDVYNYEKYKWMDIDKLIEYAYRSFDVTVLCLSRSVLDLYGKAALIKSDYNIVSAAANIDELRGFEGYFRYMEDRNGVSHDKIRLVAFDYKKDVNLPENVLGSFFGGNKYIGNISYQMDREKYRNINSFYAKAALEKQSQEYINILSYFNIIPKKTLGSKIGGLIGSFFGRG